MHFPVPFRIEECAVVRGHVLIDKDIALVIQTAPKVTYVRIQTRFEIRVEKSQDNLLIESRKGATEPAFQRDLGPRSPYAPCAGWCDNLPPIDLRAR